MTPRIDADPRAPGPVVKGFSGNRFRIDDRIADAAILLTPTAALDWAVADMADVSLASLAPVLVMEPPPEFILLGTGAAMRRPSPSLIADLAARGIGIEAMDSRAAARAWGVLRGEDRWIAAALLPIG